MGAAVVTSFSAAGWAEYGARFVEAFDEYWPPSVDLHLVSEDELERVYSKHGAARRIIRWDLALSARAQEFLTRYADTPWVKGVAPAPATANASKWRAKAGYCFRHDAYKFSKKVFAIDLIIHAIEPKRLIWLDADTVTFAPVPEELVESVVPEQFAISHLRRQKYHSECGFVGYNLAHPVTLPFIKRFAELYTSDKVFELDEWHDSWVFDWLLKEMQVPTYALPCTATNHPFINSELGMYMDHMKGSRKKLGRSRPVEQLKHKTLPYWQR